MATVLPFFLAALIPMVVGFIYYSDFVAGKAWMKSNGFVKEDLEGGNMVLTLILCYVFALILTFPLFQLVVHQAGVYGALAMIDGFGVEGSEIETYYQNFMAMHGDNHRTFGHGALHGGFMGGLGIALPIIGTNALFERRGWKYIAIHVVYWFITLALMGGVLCQFAMR